MAFGAKNKCMSAQWGDNGDTAAVMYACQVSAGGGTTSGSTLEPTKQWWVLVPVGGSSSSSWGDSQNALLATAQKQSVSIRTAANSKRSLIEGGRSHHRRARGFGHDEHMLAGRGLAQPEEVVVDSHANIVRRANTAAKKRAAAKAKAAAKKRVAAVSLLDGLLAVSLTFVADP